MFLLVVVKKACRNEQWMYCCTLKRMLIEVTKLAQEGRFDYLVIESEDFRPLPVAKHLHLRTKMVFPYQMLPN